MLIQGKPYRSIWKDMRDGKVKIIDQRKLPHLVEIVTLDNLEQTIIAIRDMYVRGRATIGATAAFGFAISMQENCSEQAIDETYSRLVAARPTAWACRIVAAKLKLLSQDSRVETAWQLAMEMADEDVNKHPDWQIWGRNHSRY